VISYCQYGGPNTNNVIAGNLIEGGHLVGIHLRNAAGNMIYNNIVRNNEIGFLSGWGDYGNNFVTQNLINDNTEDFSQNKQMDHFAFPRLNSSTAGLR
jgi:parallel beta-helix repeat protein